MYSNIITFLTKMLWIWHNIDRKTMNTAKPDWAAQTCLLKSSFYSKTCKEEMREQLLVVGRRGRRVPEGRYFRYLGRILLSRKLSSVPSSLLLRTELKWRQSRYLKVAVCRRQLPSLLNCTLSRPGRQTNLPEIQKYLSHREVKYLMLDSSILRQNH